MLTLRQNANAFFNGGEIDHEDLILDAITITGSAKRERYLWFRTLVIGKATFDSSGTEIGDGRARGLPP